MKRFLLFITTALLIVAAGFADKGYGGIKWEPLTQQEFNKYIQGKTIKAWENFPDEAQEGENKTDRLFIVYSSFKLGEEKDICVIFKTEQTQKGKYYIPESVFYFIGNYQRDLFYNLVKEKKLVGRFQEECSEELKKENEKKLMEDDSFLIRFSSEECAEINRVKYSKNIPPYNKDKANYSVYEYNEDTYLSVYDNFITNIILIIYTYHEPDY